MNTIKVTACLLVWTFGLVSCAQDQDTRQRYCSMVSQELRAYQACVMDGACEHNAHMYMWIERDQADLAEKCPTKP